MIARMPSYQDIAWGHDLPTCIHDRSKVFGILQRWQKCWTYVKPFQRSQDERGAFQALHTHYLGEPNPTSKIRQASLSQSWLKVNTMERSDSTTSIRTFQLWMNTGVNTEKLNTLKAQIMSTPAPLQESFDDTLSLYQDFIARWNPRNDNN